MSRRNSYSHTITRTFTPQETSGVGVPTDALAAPHSDGLISAGLTLWPPGAAFGSPDGQAVSLSSSLARFTRVLLSPFEWLYARAFQLALEANTQTVSELLPDWEQDFGLPEKCFTGEQTAAQRLTALRRKVMAESLAHPEDFVRVAADFGFTIELEEPNIFECGGSECGGRHEAGAVSDEAYLVVRVKDSAETFFEIGASECGVDRLYDLVGASDVLCFLRQELPGWVIAVPETWIKLAYWVTEDGDYIVDEYGNRLLFTIDP
jgi:uncharacterized protein YmfQ (DUF2313 family)